MVAELVIIEAEMALALPAAQLSRLLARHVTVAYGEFAGRGGAIAMARLVRCGIVDVLIRGVEDSRRDLPKVLDRWLLRDAWQVEGADGPGEGRLVRWAVSPTLRIRSVEELADRKGLSSRTLRRWCSDYRRSPGALVRWGRVLRVVLDVSERTVDISVAVDRERFSCVSSFRRALRGLAGKDVARLDIQAWPACRARFFQATGLRICLRRDRSILARGWDRGVEPDACAG